MIVNKVVIKTPVWDGRKVGIADFRLNCDMIEVLVDYRNKEGNLLHPYVFRMSCFKARQYPLEVVKNIPLRVIPVADFTAVAARMM